MSTTEPAGRTTSEDSAFEPPDPLRRAVADSAMTRFQWLVVALCLVINALDGFDVQVMSFTANAVTTEWGLTSSELGLLLSAGLIGVGAGSLFIAPWADRVGRRPLIIGAAAVAGIGMLLSGLAESPLQLGLLRGLTGLGIGAIITTNIVMAGEYASRRWHGMAVSLTSVGYPAGAIVGGILSVELIDGTGWRSVFLVGGVATLAVTVLASFRLPESLDYLLARQPRDALARANRMARRLGHAELTQLPPLTARPGVLSGFRTLFAPALRRSTLLIWAAFFLILAGFYFVSSWTPQLLVKAGLSPAVGISGGVLLSVGGIFGALILGALLTRFRLRNVVFGYIILAAVMMAIFLSTTSSLTAALCIAAIIGLLLNGCVTGLYALVSAIYGPGVRSTAMGSSVGVGRIGAIIAPIVAGTLLDAHWTANELYIASAVVFVVAGGLLLCVRGANLRPVRMAGGRQQPVPAAD
ncbi:MFS transporter [Pseudonocardia sp. GCM10023141]|uniref:MFS transporter n=1 Tax=Pseudonocardia sp. GCM10023141 TaxID=3252653 RepID=UPI00361608A4